MEERSSPNRSLSLSEAPFAFSDRTQVFQQGEDGQGRDAATMLRGTGISEHVGRNESMHQGNLLDEEGTSSSPLKTDLQYFGSENIVSADDTGAAEDASTQFDMDVAVAYGTPSPGQNAHGVNAMEVESPPVVLMSNDDNEIEVGLERSRLPIQIDKDKVPCPRLCGGSFSPGFGGIVCFNNGEVRKMWSWYTAPTSTGKAKTESLQQNTLSESKALHESAEQGDLSVFSSKPEELPMSRRQELPRTLKDLEDMTDHARFSQWKSDESSGGESSMDEESDESLDGLASEDDEEAEVDMEARKRMYEKYFGVSPGGLLESSPPNGSISPPRSPARSKQSAKSSDTAPEGNFAGPSSDLVASVYIAYDHDTAVLGGQSKELALGLMFGEWDPVEEDGEMESPSPNASSDNESSHHNRRRDSFSYQYVREGRSTLPRPHSGKAASSLAWLLRFLLPVISLNRSLSPPLAELPQGNAPNIMNSPSRDDDKMIRVRSDPMLAQPSAQPLKMKNKYGIGSDDHAVHGGAYTKPPKEKEQSLVIMRKIMRGDAQMQPQMSPLDSPLRKYL